MVTRRIRAVAMALALPLVATPASGQEEGRPGPEPGARTAGAWNGPRALALARSAIEARRHAYADTSLHDFVARAEGHVHFLAEFAGERRLVRTDQIALRVLWQAPGRALQTIVGRRHEKGLPTNIRYHIDHLSLVLENYGDRIRLGEGEEVRDVLHPAAAGATDFYDYRLVDSLEIRLQGDAYRVYRLQVRPSDPSTAGVVGTVFVERTSGAIARMSFTFTAPAYIDDDLDYITVDLSSGLWDGRRWLPAEQRVEIRRQVSWLSYPVGGVIRSRFRVTDYEINRGGFQLHPGERVTSLPPAELRAFEGWERSLEDGSAAGGGAAALGMEEVRRRARELVDPRTLVGTGMTQLHLPSASGAVRARRAEGLLIGGGLRHRIGRAGEARTWLGYGFARERPEAEVGYAHALGAVEVGLTAFADRLADIGPFPAAAGAVSTFGFLLEGDDYTDPYFEDGAALRAAGPALGGRASLTASWARHEAARLVGDPPGDTGARPVREVSAGDMAELGAAWDRELGRLLGAPVSLRAAGTAGLEGPGDYGFTRLLVEIRAREADSPGRPWGWRAHLAAGIAGGVLPPQRVYLLGGRGTVPGYGFREWGGDRVALLRLETHRDLAHPWVRLRAIAAAGWAEQTAVTRAGAATLGVAESAGVRPAAGLGLGLFYDILQLDVVRGLDGGEWQLLFSVDPAFWEIL